MRRNAAGWSVPLWALALSLLGSCRPFWLNDTPQPATGAPVFVEAHSFPPAGGAKSGISRLDVDVRVPLGFFVLVRTPPMPGAAADSFTGRAELAVEILDQKGNSAARKILTRTISSPDASTPSTPEPIRPESYLEELVSFELPPGEYSLQAEVSDLESSRRFMERGGEVTVKEFPENRLSVSDLIFLDSTAPGDSLTAANAAPVPAGPGGDVPFGARACGYAEFTSGAPAESIRASWVVHPSPSVREALPPGGPDSLARLAVRTDAFLEPVKQGEGFRYRVSRRAPGGRYAVWLPAISDTLPEGEYELELPVTDGRSSVTLRQNFRIRWIDMPRSLRATAKAVEALRYVASDSELNEMRSASPGRQKTLLERFWKRRDPTPATAFNERMAEYYRRVDYATEKYSSIREANGMKSDRGKAYILYGPPASVERDLRPGRDFQEIWKYPALGKRLVFVDRDHHGEYRLSETGEL